MLDRCIEDGLTASADEILALKSDFRTRLDLAWRTFGGNVFRYRNEQNKWKPSIPLYDAVMVALDTLWGQAIASWRKKPRWCRR